MTIQTLMGYMAKQNVVLLSGLFLLWMGNLAVAGELQTRFFKSNVRPLNQQMALSAAQPDWQDFAVSGDATGVQISGRKISRGGALLRSLLVPGWGEYYLGYKSTGRLFIAADVLLWASVIGFETYSQWKEDQFVAFAAEHSGAQLEGKSDGFYADIGNYNSTEEYNEAKLRNRDYEALYTDPSYFWAWDSDQNRLDYDYMRIESRSAHNKIYFFIGAAALNRLISFIDTGKKATNLLRQSRQPRIGFQLQPQSHGDAGAIRLVVNAEF